MVSFLPIVCLFTLRFLQASNLNIIFSRIFSWRLCGCDDSVNPAVVVPVDRDFEVEDSNSRLLHPGLLGLFHNDPKVRELLTLNPSNRENTNELISKCKNCDRLSNLCFDLLNWVLRFLDFESLLNLGRVNRTFLIYQIQSSRFILFKNIESKITSGVEICHKSTLSASYLNNLERPLHHLLTKEKRVISRYYYSNQIDGTRSESLKDTLSEIEKKLDRVTDLNSFLLLSLQFYRRTDIKAYWELFEVLLKIGFIDPDSLIRISEFGVEDILLYSCQIGCLCVIKSLLKENSTLLKRHLCSGAYIALDFGHFKVFKTIFNSLKNMNMKIEEINDFLRKAVLSNRIEFARLLFETFEQLSSSDSSILFMAIRKRNIETIKLIVSFKGVDCIYQFLGLNMCALDLTAKNNFHEGTKYFLQVDGRATPSMISSAIKFAIRYNASESLKVLIEEVLSFSPLDEFVSKHDIAIFLASCVVNRNISALKLILSSIDLKTFKSLGLILDSSLSTKISIFSSVIHYAIEFKFQEGFEALIEHFGVDALDVKDGNGRTPFLFAVHKKNLDFALTIAKLNPDSVKIHDKNGNTALHVIMSPSFPLPFIKAISELNLISWEARNEALLTPLDILDSNKHRFSAENFQNLSELLLEIFGK